MNRFLSQTLEQVELDNKAKEDWLRSSYDTLYGFLCAVPDAYARAKLVRHLDNLYETSLQTIPDSSSVSAETVDVKTTSPPLPGGASTASSTTPSGSSHAATSRDLSYPASEDVETR